MFKGFNRRPVELNERIFLQEQKAVSETVCDLGLTVLRSDEVCDMMQKDYPKKYEVYKKVFNYKF